MSDLSVKELEIYRGVNRLLDAGENPYTLKASDIAKAAGIAKGSIYNYFETKDEAVGKAIIHRLRESISQALMRASSFQGFQGQFYACLDYVEEVAGGQNSLFHLLVFSGQNSEILSHVKRGMEEFCLNQLEVDRFLMGMIHEGCREGILEEQEQGYAYAVIASAILGFFHQLCRGEMSREQIDTAKEYAYRMALKALK